LEKLSTKNLQMSAKVFAAYKGDIMKEEDIKKKREMLVQQHNTLKDKIDEAKTAIGNMQAQLNGLVGAVQLCDDFLNNPEKQNPKTAKVELNQENIK
jgi:UPF0288 family protein (methanogenesis marker protein 3)